VRELVAERDVGPGARTRKQAGQDGARRQHDGRRDRIRTSSNSSICSSEYPADATTKSLVMRWRILARWSTVPWATASFNSAINAAESMQSVEILLA